MANIKSARKAHSQDEKRRKVNLARRSALKTAIKKFHNALAAREAQEQLEVQLRAIAAQLSRARGKGLLKQNTASRTISRLTLRMNAVKAA